MTRMTTMRWHRIALQGSPPPSCPHRKTWGAPLRGEESLTRSTPDSPPPPPLQNNNNNRTRIQPPPSAPQKYEETNENKKPSSSRPCYVKLNREPHVLLNCPRKEWWKKKIKEWIRENWTNAKTRTPWWLTKWQKSVPHTQLWFYHTYPLSLVTNQESRNGISKTFCYVVK